MRVNAWRIAAGSTCREHTRRAGIADLTDTASVCRWAKDRYEGAVSALVHILKKMQATQPDACVLRPVLRDEARKAIGTNAL